MFEDLVNHVTRQHTWAHDRWEEAVRKGEEMYGTGKVKYVATADGPDPRSNGQKVYVKGISSTTGQEELFEIANVIVTFEAKWSVAQVSLTHGEYDGTYFSTGTAPLGDQNTVQLVYTETHEEEFDLIGRLDGTLETLGIQMPAETDGTDADITEPNSGARQSI